MKSLPHFDGYVLSFLISEIYCLLVKYSW